MSQHVSYAYASCCTNFHVSVSLGCGSFTPLTSFGGGIVPCATSSGVKSVTITSSHASWGTRKTSGLLGPTHCVITLVGSVGLQPAKVPSGDVPPGHASHATCPLLLTTRNGYLPPDAASHVHFARPAQISSSC